ncbi:MAG: ABC transporter substrate-binding protein/permease [Bacillota bacterium]|nr:ABC transporter substrate-binding protein/permease [Bacillota bacterium]
MRRRIYCLLLALLLVSASVFILPSQAKASEDNVLRIGLEAAYPPFNWTQKTAANGAVPIEGSSDFANGYDVQMARKIAESLGKDLVAVKIEWDGLVPALTSGRIDLIMAGMSPTAERAKQIDFSDAYYESDLVMVVSGDGAYSQAKSLEDFSAARIVAQLNTFHDTVIDQIPQVNHLEAMSDFSIMRVAVQTGKADGYVAERPEAMAAQAAGVGLMMVDLNPGFETSPEDTQIAIGIKKDNPLREELNEILATISLDQRLDLMDQMNKLQNSEDQAGSFMTNMKNIFAENKGNFLRGTGITLIISLVGTLVGLLIGLFVGIIRTIPASLNKGKNLVLNILKALANVYVQVLRGTPMIVQSVLVYFGLLQFAGINLSPMEAAFLVVSVNTGAYLSEVVRAGINSIDQGQFEAASALGMTHFQTMTQVVLPQALRNIIPAIGNEFIVNIKDTSVLNVIAVNELFFTTKSIVGGNLMYFETYLITSIIYLTLTLSIAYFLHFVEKMLADPETYVRSKRTDVMKSAN